MVDGSGERKTRRMTDPAQPPRNARHEVVPCAGGRSRTMLLLASTCIRITEVAMKQWCACPVSQGVNTSQQLHAIGSEDHLSMPGNLSRGLPMTGSRSLLANQR